MNHIEKLHSGADSIANVLPFMKPGEALKYSELSDDALKVAEQWFASLHASLPMIQAALRQERLRRLVRP